MFNVGGSIIGLHDPATRTIQFNGVFIGKQNVSFALKSETNIRWYVTVIGYTTSDLTINLNGYDVCSIDGNGLLTYDKAKLENAGLVSGYTLKPYYTDIQVNCRAYAPDGDSYEQLTLYFRYGQISV